MSGNGLKSEKEVVNLALREYIIRQKQMCVLSLFNTITYNKKYRPKKGRDRKFFKKFPHF